MAQATPVVFIPALLCDDALYADVIARLGDQIEPHVLMSPKPLLADSVADILARAPATFALVGTSYGGNLALAVALAAPERVIALWLMGCDPAAAAAGGPDLAGGLEATPEPVFDMLAGLVVHPDHTEAAATFKAMAGRVGGPAGAAQARALAARADITAKLGTLHMPALVFWGADDALVPPAVGRALSDELPHAHFFALPGCGHLPTLEKPAEAAAAFGAFLEEELHHGH
jgi:pimeloyl-ACP methyl ester carboxylesterase